MNSRTKRRPDHANAVRACAWKGDGRSDLRTDGLQPWRCIRVVAKETPSVAHTQAPDPLDPELAVLRVDSAVMVVTTRLVGQVTMTVVLNDAEVLGTAPSNPDGPTLVGDRPCFCGQQRELTDAHAVRVRNRDGGSFERWVLMCHDRLQDT